MSQHPSLSSGKKHKRHRSILKRYERLKHMKEKGMWDDEKGSIFGLPKIKMLKFKVKKEKTVEETPAAEVAAAGAEAGVPAETTAEPREGKEKVREKSKEKDASKKEKK